MDQRTKKQTRAAALLAFAAALATALCLLVVIYLRDVAPWPVMVLLVVAIFGVAFRAMRPWWRSLDHMERDGHLISWFWGTNFGTPVAVMVTLMISLEPYNPYLAGAVLVLVAQLLGYTAMMLYWSIAHRGDAS